MTDKRRLGYMDSRGDGWAKGYEKGRTEGYAESLKDAIMALGESFILR